LETVSIGTPLLRVIVVANVCRAIWKVSLFCNPHRYGKGGDTFRLRCEKPVKWGFIVDTYPVQNSYVAEYLTIEKGKITSNTTIYDSVPYQEYAAKQPKHQ